MKNFGMSIIKYILFVFNLVFALSGVGIIVAGAVVLADVSEYNSFVTSDLLGPPIVLIVAGAIVFIIAFLGCFGAIKESYNMLMAFAGLLVIIFIIELAVGIAAAVYKSDFQEALRDSLKNSMHNYSDSNSPEKISWDNVQKKLMCCGVDGPSDWQLVTGQSTPSSCCTSDKLDQETEAYCLNNAFGTYMFKTGCFEQLKGKFESNSKILIGVGIGIAFVEVIGIFLACWLAYTVKKEESEK